MTGLRIDEAISIVRAAAAEGLMEAARHVLTVSNAHAPHEGGDLETSGKASADPSTLTAAVSYDTEYAVRQHEQMDLHHDAGRSSKYLEHAVTGEAATVTQIIRNAVHGRLGS